QWAIGNRQWAKKNVMTGNQKSIQYPVTSNQYPVSSTQHPVTSNQHQSMPQKAQKYFHKEMDKKAGLEHTYHRTKIVATVGPACDTYEKLLELVQAGVNVFRLNFSHGTHEDKKKIIDHIRKLNKTEPYNIAILGDLQGPKLRVGEIINNA